MISNTITLNRKDFKEVFIGLDWGKYQPINLLSATEPDMYKKGNPYADGNLVKVQSNNHFMGMNYEARVLSQMDKEGLIGTFNAQASWFRHITKSLVHHKDNPDRLYLMLEHHPNMKPYGTEYFYKNEPIEKRLFEAFLKPHKTPTSQPQQRKVFPLTYAFESVREVTINHIRYILK